MYPSILSSLVTYFFFLASLQCYPALIFTTCSYHFSIFSVCFLDTCCSFYMLVLDLILSFFLTPHIHLEIRISSLSCIPATVSSQVLLIHLYCRADWGNVDRTKLLKLQNNINKIWTHASSIVSSAFYSQATMVKMCFWFYKCQQSYREVHSYKLMSAIVARRLMTTLEGHLPDTQAGFRPARGCRDKVCALRWFIEIILREGRQAIITFIDYSAAFDTESQMFLDEALAEAGVGAKVRRIVQAIFAAATGDVRLRHPDGTMTLRAIRHRQRSTPGGHLLVRCMYRRLDRIFRMHDLQNPGVTVGVGESTTIMSKFEYADDAALVDADAVTATARVTALAAGSLTDAWMVISLAKSKVMHIHRKTRVSSTIEAEVEALKLAHKCEACSRTFQMQRGLKIHAARNGGVTQRSRRGSPADRAVQTAKRRAAEALLSQV